MFKNWSMASVICGGLGIVCGTAAFYALGIQHSTLLGLYPLSAIASFFAVRPITEEGNHQALRYAGWFIQGAAFGVGAPALVHVMPTIKYVP